MVEALNYITWMAGEKENGSLSLFSFVQLDFFLSQDKSESNPLKAG